MRKLILLPVILIAINATNAQDTTFLYYNTWFFDNFNRADTTVTWDMFRENYIGVPPSRDVANPFEKVIFDEVYKKILYPKGHCFGMDLMAQQVYKYGGYAGFCSPAYIYPGIPHDPDPWTAGPTDPNLLHAIQMEHGRQLSHRFLLHMLDIIAASKNRDGNFAFDQFRYYQSRGEPTLISITKSLLPSDGGHALLPYDAVDLGSKRRIYVYDVNRSFHLPNTSATAAEHHEYYIQGLNYIEITKSTGAWSFDKGDEVWSGSPSSGTGGGNLVLMPHSIMNTRDRLPQSLFADAATALGKIFIFAGTEISGFSTPDGRQLTVLKIDRSDPSMETLRSIYPFIPLNGGSSIKAQTKLYFIRGEEDFEVQYLSGKGLHIEVFSETHRITFLSEGTVKAGSIRLKNFNSLSPGAESADKSITIRIERFNSSIEPTVCPELVCLSNE